MFAANVSQVRDVYMCHSCESAPLLATLAYSVWYLNYVIDRDHQHNTLHARMGP